MELYRPSSGKTYREKYMFYYHYYYYGIDVLLLLLDINEGEEETGFLPLYKLLYFVNKLCPVVRL